MRLPLLCAINYLYTTQKLYNVHWCKILFIASQLASHDYEVNQSVFINNGLLLLFHPLVFFCTLKYIGAELYLHQLLCNEPYLQM